MYIAETMVDSAWLSLRKSTSKARVRLFCFPYSGAGASIFSTWARELPDTVEVAPVQLPGRENRLSEPLFTRLSPLIEALAEAILPHLHKPFAFFGHSLGALVSYELTRYLRRHHGIGPLHLYVSGHAAPQLPLQKPPIHHLPEVEFVEELRRFNGTPEEVLIHDELRQLILPILRADFAIYETYTYTAEPPLECPISVFAGLQDDHVDLEQIEAWGEQTNQPFSIHMLPGDHFFVNSSRSMLLQTLAGKLRMLHTSA